VRDIRTDIVFCSNTFFRQNLPTFAAHSTVLMIGKLHLLLLHFPIGLLLFALALEVGAYFLKKEQWSVPGKLALTAGCVMAILAAGAGWILAGQGGYEQAILDSHAIWAYVTVGSSVATWLLRRTRWYQPLLLVSSVAVCVAGHYGGSLTHGEGFLWQAAMPKELHNPTATLPQLNAQSVVYQAVIQPILEKKCISCHNASKSKGDLRMDDPALFAKGGKHGAAFIAGQPAQSRLLQRALLPLHAEEHMPPAGKAQLTPDEIRLLTWWIEQGASFDRTLGDTPQSADIAALLAVGAAAAIPLNPVWNLAPKPAQPADITALRGQRIAVIERGAGTPWLMVSLAGVRAFSPELLKLLGRIGPNVVDLDAAHTPLTDAELRQIIAAMPHLTRLHLAQTKVTDAGLADAPKLKYLEWLNLTQTRTTAATLAHLGKLEHLKALYTWQSDITDDAALAFQRTKNGLTIQTGQRPVLPTDTAQLQLKPPKILLAKRVFDDTVIVMFEYPKMVELHYTLDGASPTAQTIRYDGKPLVLSAQTQIRALTTKSGWKDSPIVEEMFLRRGIVPVDVTMPRPPKSPYDAKGPKSLCDLLTSLDASDGTYIGDQGADVEAIMDLGASKPIKKCHIHAFESSLTWTYLPAGITIWVSDDGKKWTQRLKKSYPITKEGKLQAYWITETLPEGTVGRYVKIRFHNVGKNPAWHPNKGKPCWVAVDEVVLE
jgi:uncharacterized membrane protein/mono/diheme cytochrome c family protein